MWDTDRIGRDTDRGIEGGRVVKLCGCTSEMITAITSTYNSYYVK